MGSKAKTPQPNPTADYNQYLAEGSNALRAQDQLLRQQMGYEAGLQPLLTAQQMQSLQGQSRGLLGLYGNLYDEAGQFQKRYAGDQLTMLGGLGAQSTNAAINSLDPTTRGIYSTFGQQALTDLQAGTSLNSAETAQAQQSARAAGAARGMSFSRQGSDLEVLNTYNMGQKRLAQRQGVARQAYEMGANQQQIGLQGFLSPAFNASQQYGLSGLVQSAQSTYGSLGSSSFLTPESQYLANIRANRIQMETAIQSANAARSGAIWGGVAQGVGAAIGKCWVAREVYGKDNPEWVIFRNWLDMEAPKWIDDLYLEEGERLAAYISDKPILKSIIKMGMDIIVKPRLGYIIA